MNGTAMVSYEPGDLLESFTEAIQHTSNEMELWSVMQSGLIQLPVRMFLDALGFITNLLEGEATTMWRTPQQDDMETCVARWDCDGDTFSEDGVIYLTRQGIACLEVPQQFAFALMGYCMFRDIPFIGHRRWGNLVPEYCFQSKAKERDEKIAAVLQRAEADRDNIDLHEECLRELARLNAPYPPQGTVLSQRMTEIIEPESRRQTRH